MSASEARACSIPGMLSLEEARLLYRLARESPTGVIVEIGSFHGRSTVALAGGSAAGHSLPVYAVDPYLPFVGACGGRFGPHDRAPLLRHLLLAGRTDLVWVVNLTSAQAAACWDGRAVGLLWIDGDHTYPAVLGDFTAWETYLAADGLIAFHDSIDPKLGPSRLIGELLSSGRYRNGMVVDKITVLRRVAPAEFPDGPTAPTAPTAPSGPR